MIRYSAADAASIRETLLERVKADVADCYQCGNCSAGCPSAFTFDHTPNQIMRMLQLGMVDEVLASKSVQLCIQCLTCSARCPRNIDISGIFETLKTIAAAKDLDVPEQAATFNRLFIKNIARYGRLTEAMFLVRFNLAAMKPFNDSSLGLPMLTKGKLHPIPRKAKGADEVGRIVRKAMEKAR